VKDCYSFIPTSALVRKKLREEMKNRNWKRKGNNKLRHFLMGNVQMNKDGQTDDPTRFSAIQVSHIYNIGEHLEFRIWGWIPKNLVERYKVQRKDVISFLVDLFNNLNNNSDSKDFWKDIFECDCIQKTNGSIVIGYPKDNWNFIDFGSLDNFDEKKKAFESMLGGENE